MIPLNNVTNRNQRRTVTYTFIVLNVILFVADYLGGHVVQVATKGATGVVAQIPSLIGGLASFRIDPQALAANPGGLCYTLITATFMHNGFLHLATNMLFLHAFGPAVESSLGHLRFLIFYLVCGICAGLAQALYGLQHTPWVIAGASGAIAGVMAAHIIYHPKSTVRTVLPILFYFVVLDLPAELCIGYWLVLQFSNLLILGSGSGDIGYYGHFGGFICGLILAATLQHRHLPPPTRRRPIRKRNTEENSCPFPETTSTPTA